MIERILMFVIAAIIIILIGGIRTVRPTERALIERLGKYKKFASPGFNWVIPMIDKLRKVNITEQSVDAEEQEIITNDNLNATVDAQIYFKIKSDEGSIKACQYNVHNVKYQITNLARTSLRNIIGTLSLKEANSQRDMINDQLTTILNDETKQWGIDVVRAELKEISPPKDVQGTMNQIVIAENEKIAAKDFATASETRADGEKRSRIKQAEGEKSSAILRSEGLNKSLELEAEGNKKASVLHSEGVKKSLELEAEGKKKAFELINASFKDAAKEHKRLEVLENSLKNNSKIIITEKGISPQLIIGDIPAGIIKKN